MASRADLHEILSAILPLPAPLCDFVLSYIFQDDILNSTRWAPSQLLSCSAHTQNRLQLALVEQKDKEQAAWADFLADNPAISKLVLQHKLMSWAPLIHCARSVTFIALSSIEDLKLKLYYKDLDDDADLHYVNGKESNKASNKRRRGVAEEDEE